jgi:predicted DNA-binding protein (MmcQ/YjbR family)
VDLADAVEFCLSKPGAEETTPFGPDVLVYKVGGKMFATAGMSEETGRMNLKCNPERSADLRERYEAILPGYHMNKRHWNTIVFDGTLPPALVRELIEISYALVVAGLSKKARGLLDEA